jgi:hypothetical protein
MSPAFKTWLLWIGAATALGGYLGTVLFGEQDRTVFLPGRTTDGHHQIELACTACHQPDFKNLGRAGVLNDACLRCHGDELEQAVDAHPVKKFRDPRTAPLLGKVDAMRCVTCHREHDEKITRPMAVTQPLDYCLHCHQSIAKDRPSHQGLSFRTCSTSGCHNFHDNQALYESFLVRHAGEPDRREDPRVPWLEHLRPTTPRASLVIADADAPADRTFERGLLADWAETAHARAGVNCTACHETVDDRSGRRVWADRAEWTSCRGCHEEPAKGFLAGKHGMRLAQGLTPMTPSMARQPMKADAAHRALTCTSCHGSHRFDRRTAAAQACLGCHDDTHTRAYTRSTHFALWEGELRGTSPAGSGVSCATCHMPREARSTDGATHTAVQHNQNANLRPNEKMVRTTCLACHGLAFSLDSMADETLIARNFEGRPAQHVRSVDMAADRERARRGSEGKPKEMEKQ